MKILIVEDDQLLSLLLKRLVQRMGYSVIDTVTEGEQAVEIAHTKAVDLILMDIMLEGDIDGITAMQQIQAQKNIPAIYITGNSDNNTVRRAQKTQYIKYLVKPVDHNQLRELCREFKEKLN